MIDDKDTIINAFRPIEQFFKIMDMASAEFDDNFARTYAEVGLALCTNYRTKVEQVFNSQDGENKNEQ